jgi:hypothetical protein
MASTSVPSNNIGTHPEDVPRSNNNLGGEDSATNRLWKRYRTELAERDKPNSGRAETAGKDIDGSGLSHVVPNWLRRLVARLA